MVATQGFHDISRKFIARNTDGLVTNDTRQGNHGNTGGSAADINDHITDRFFHINADTQGRSHGFMYQVNFFGARLFGTVAYSPFFHFRDTGRNADHHTPAGWEQRLFGIDHLDHFPYHEFSRIKIGNNPVFQGADRTNALMRLFVHHQGPLSYSQNGFRIIPVKCNDTRLINYNLVIMNDQGICGAQIHSNLLRQEIE